MRQGFGNILADGFKSAIEKIGKGSDYYAIQIKGMSNLHSDERATPSFTLGIATSTRGADHLRSRPAIDLYGLPEKLLREIYGGEVSSDYTSYDGKSRMVWWQELLYAVTDSIGICKFQTVFCAVHAPKFEEFSKLIEYTSDLKFSKPQLMEIGERIVTVERMFNNREGFSRKDDKFPAEWFHSLKFGDIKLQFQDFFGEIVITQEIAAQLLNDYYNERGWDSITGNPTKKKIKELSLEVYL